MTHTHGHAEGGVLSPELRAWYGMKDRCYRKKCKKFARYGGRGIAVCDKWRNNFLAFLSDIGPRPSAAHSIERDDVDGNYEPGNVRWATQKEQQRNRTDNRIVKFNGQAMSLAEAAERSGLRYGLIKRRLQLGWPSAQLFIPPKPRCGSRSITRRPRPC